jgi:hypothetical protein
VVAGSRRRLLSRSISVCSPGQEVCRGAGGRLYCGLPARSRAYVRRSHVPPLQISKARAIVSLDGTNNGPASRVMFAREAGLFALPAFVRAVTKLIV